jgi:hypothetical protein
LVCGVAIGFAIVESDNLSPGDQRIVAPGPAACTTLKGTPLTEHKIVSFDAVTENGLPTFTLTVSLNTQPVKLSVAMTVYVVAVAGVSTGFRMPALLTPVIGCHEYIRPVAGVGQ